ncbi:MAG TPA: methyltransferase [Gammaproteobacteria bacterium]|nr:methyltransferase [Gammaproteobacteria bacterium]
MQSVKVSDLPYVVAEMSYTKPLEGEALVRVFPPSSGRKTENPPRERISVPVYDCRPIVDRLELDEAGFEVLKHPSSFHYFYDPEKVKNTYYPESEQLIKEATGALEVFVFDHNIRNQPRSDKGEIGVREPVDGAHNDYTLSSGPRRIREILENNNALKYIDHRAALINLWRPIVGPVQDFPLAVCHARTTKLADFIPTRIQHYLEDDLETPSLTGEIYSFQHSDAHRWFAISDMQPDEAILLKCFDLADDGRAIFTGHTGYKNPACPPNFKPRESIELRTVVVFP